ncbi:Ribonuclease H2, subunit C like protein [Aduncisulcus paluster]|uniref:Ribonuclease H2, subunit C like protein n=1 Tax=Aduncisulcus paluster TaxID=2918883 RepID=A0ABQ5JUV2_9EUKA|nr:Ribonuclease H2, subunit C like protein [Aduncisulcus paluster]
MFGFSETPADKSSKGFKTPTAEIKQSNIFLLPCNIDSGCACDSKLFFESRIIEKKDGSKEAFFRGRKMYGKPISLSSNSPPHLAVVCDSKGGDLVPSCKSRILTHFREDKSVSEVKQAFSTSMISSSIWGS